MAHGTLAGIIVAVAITLLLSISAGWLLLRRKRRQKTDNGNSMYHPPNSIASPKREQYAHLRQGPFEMDDNHPAHVHVFEMDTVSKPVL